MKEPVPLLPVDDCRLLDNGAALLFVADTPRGTLRRGMLVEAKLHSSAATESKQIVVAAVRALNFSTLKLRNAVILGAPLAEVRQSMTDKRAPHELKLRQFELHDRRQLVGGQLENAVTNYVTQAAIAFADNAEHPSAQQSAEAPPASDESSVPRAELASNDRDAPGDDASAAPMDESMDGEQVAGQRNRKRKRIEHAETAEPSSASATSSAKSARTGHDPKTPAARHARDSAAAAHQLNSANQAAMQGAGSSFPALSFAEQQVLEAHCARREAELQKEECARLRMQLLESEERRLLAELQLARRASQ